MVCRPATAEIDGRDVRADGPPGPDLGIEAVPVILPPVGQRPRQVPVPDDLRAGLGEDARAEDVVGMHVRQDHVADRHIRARPDRAPERLPDPARITGIDDGDGGLSDDHAEIGHVSAVLFVWRVHLALVHEDPGRHLGQIERGAGGPAGRCV